MGKAILSRDRSAGYHLAGHPQAEMTAGEVNELYNLAKMLNLGSSAEEIQIQRFSYVVPAASTTDKTWTTTVDQCKVIGGYMRVTGVDADYDFDLGKTGDTDCFINDFNSGSSSDATKELPLDPAYLQDGDDVILTIASNSNTGPVTVEVALLCTHDTQFAPTMALSAARTLTKLDSGTSFFLSSSGGAFTVSLPAVQEGLNFRFYVLEDTPTGAITIAATGAIVDLNVLSGDATTAKMETTAGTAVTNVIIGTGARQGSYLDYICDGTTWYVTGSGTPDDWITTS